MKKINILFLFGSFLHGLGGTERQLRALIKGLDRRRFKITVVQLHEPIEYPIEPEPMEGITVHTVHLKRIYSYSGFRAVRTISKIIIAEKIDIIHSFFEFSDILGVIAGKLTNVPCIISSRRDTGFTKSALLLKCYRVLNHFFNLVLVNAEAVKANAYKNEKIKYSMMKTIYNGIDHNRYNVQVDMEKKKRDLGIEPMAPVVGIIANLKPIKGHVYFLEAASYVVKKHPDVNYLIVGDGPLREALMKHAQELNVSLKVKFAHLRDDIPEIISILDISVLSSLTEGCSNTILESMAGGKPVIATHVGGNPELVVHEETGLLVPPRDANALAEALCRLIEDRRTAQRMGENGRRRVEKLFHLKNMISEHERIYHEAALYE